jgi:transposase-like protein
MKTKSPLKDLTLIQIILRFDTDNKARKHLEAVLWKGGIVCPHCQCKDKAKFSDIKANPVAGTRAGLRWCSDCKKPFTVTIGTIFEDSKIPLRKWLIAWYMICSSKKGISSLQLQRILELGSYRTALFMAHRIRHALRDTEFAEKLDGTIEADECFMPVGAQSESEGKAQRKHAMVFTMVQRGGSSCVNLVKDTPSDRERTVGFDKDTDFCPRRLLRWEAFSLKIATPDSHSIRK